MSGTRRQGWLKSTFIIIVMITVISVGIDHWRNQHLALSAQQRVVSQTINQQHIDWFSESYQQPVVLYFWATWCSVCRFVSPSVDRLAQYQQSLGVKVVSVAIRSGDERLLRAYMANKDYRFPVINDQSGLLSQHIGISATPTLVIIKNGNIVNATTGITTPWGLAARTAMAQYL